MNWKLILQLSLFGMAMGFATVFWIPVNFEWVFWLIIFLTCAYLIASRISHKYFLHGFMVGILNSIWITAIHFIFYETYIGNHPEIEAMNANMPTGLEPRVMMVIMGPFIGALSGIVLGLFAFLASKFAKKATAHS